MSYICFLSLSGHPWSSFGGGVCAFLLPRQTQLQKHQMLRLFCKSSRGPAAVNRAAAVAEQSKSVASAMQKQPWTSGDQARAGSPQRVKAPHLPVVCLEYATTMNIKGTKKQVEKGKEMHTCKRTIPFFALCFLCSCFSSFILLFVLRTVLMCFVVFPCFCIFPFFKFAGL